MTVGAAQNVKLGASPIAWVPEIEAADPCIYMEGADNSKSPLCGNACYAGKLWRIRRAKWKGAKKTPAKGLVRLGTWKEVLPHEWQQFKAGRGTRMDGSSWERADFPTRPYFVVTRGLLPFAFYERVAADPRALNIQVSVDVDFGADGRVLVTPGEGRLRRFLELPNVLFRLKTVARDTANGGTMRRANVREVEGLVARLGIPKMRVLETPLRLGGSRSYRTTTPLEAAGWDPRSFLRCNSECHECPVRKGVGENRVLGCAVTPKIVEELQRVGNVASTRVEAMEPFDVEWSRLVREALKALGGTASNQALYAEVLRLEPRLERHGYFHVKVRSAVQHVGVQVTRGVWKLEEGPLAANIVQEVGRQVGQEA